MNTSLIALCEQSRDLSEVGTSNLHFPETGDTLLTSLEQNHFWYTARRSVIKKLLKSVGIKPGDQSVKGLDIGCGSGYTAVNFSEQELPTWGVDAHRFFSKYQSEGRGAGFAQGNIFSIEPAAEFDFILLLDVVEHIKNDVGFLNQSLKFLKPGGRAIITVPAFPWLWSKSDDDWGHQRRYTKNSFSMLINSLETEVIVERQFYFFAATFLPFMVSRLLQRLNRAKTEIAKVESEPPALLNQIVKKILLVEELFIHTGGLPFGSSLVLQLKRP